MTQEPWYGQKLRVAIDNLPKAPDGCAEAYQIYTEPKGLTMAGVPAKLLIATVFLHGSDKLANARRLFKGMMIRDPRS